MYIKIDSKYLTQNTGYFFRGFLALVLAAFVCLGVAFRFLVGWAELEAFLAPATLGTVDDFCSATAKRSEAAFSLFGLKKDCMDVCFC